MTREEIIRNLKYTLEKHKNDTVHTFDTNISVMCKDILDYLEQEPCEDAISRQAVLDGLASIAKAKAKSDAQKSLMGRVMFFTEHLPSVTPQPKTGHWKYAEQLQTEICSCCGCIKGNYFFSDIEVPIKFCPNCGATMTESEDKE